MKLNQFSGLNLICHYDFQSSCFEKSTVNENHRPDFNGFSDSILATIYDNPTSRGIILSSINPFICLSFCLKQPHYPVFCITECGYGETSFPLTSSLQKTVRFAKSSKLLGIICRA
eukprot:Sdes_comp9861_c0_seq1m1404